MDINFLMSTERSGSNLLVNILNSHSKICGPSTKHIINPVARNLFRYEPLTVEQNWIALVEDIRGLINARFSVWKTQLDRDELFKLAGPGDIAELIRNIFHQEAAAHKKISIFIKENQLYEFIVFLLFNFSESKYVYLVRDPRDMALSWKKSSIHRGGVSVAARQWQKDQIAYLKIFRELNKVNKAFFIRYEDLISSPETVLDELVKFLGYSYEPSMLEFYKNEFSGKNARMQKAWENLGKELMPNNKEKYKKELSVEEVKVVEAICYSEMILYGYDPAFEESDLVAFSSQGLADFESRDSVKENYQIPAGVDENMKAKKRLYRHKTSRLFE